MKILILSAYDAESHKAWRQHLVDMLPFASCTSLALPPRHFSWRIRGNALTWALAQHATLCKPWDLVVATSMVDLATLRGLVPELAKVPAIVYFHENQFAYPASRAQHASVEPQMVTLYAALTADRVVFNTHYNRASFLAGVAALLDKLPDGVPPGVAERIADKSDVIPVPVAIAGVSGEKPDDAFHLVWNHRWEYDKGPENLYYALARLPVELPLRVHVVGQRFRREPAVFADIRRLLDERAWLGEWGYLAKRDSYENLLAKAHAVLSTSLHDFQGLSVLEAVAAGCVPIVPNRLAYPELLSTQWCYSIADTEGQGPEFSEADACARMVRLRVEEWMRAQLPTAPSLDWLSPAEQAKHYRHLVKSVAVKKTNGGPEGTIAPV
ncbi:tRNA-queuosine alpha-mannosyltransferase domain-containing protein [Teredinibacter turnerae]|uniref:tRNA-queuosine alpha-mannosyltransferase domain-containing protein n=1 Tax=Teredinibacter turnerae TaxID=2426 RepID=UPI0003696572|nr:DUF3524 domain-containing protein [Teredinibacter turnerae]